MNALPEAAGVPGPTCEHREFVTALARGLEVLHAFDRDRAQMTLSEVARATGLSPGTARRCLFTLACLGYVGSQDKRYFLLPKVVSIGAAYLSAARVDEAIVPYLRDLVSRCGDSSTLAVLDGGFIMHLASYSSKRLIRMTVGLGTRFPAYATSMGRVLLAQLPPERLDAALESVPRRPFTRYTVTEIAELKRIVAAARSDGYARVNDELEDGLSSLAVPVRVNGEVVAALNSSTFFQAHADDASRSHRLGVLRETAETIAGAIRRLPALAHSLSTR